MDRTKIKTIGFSILSQPGDYMLELDHIRAINTKDTLGDFDIIEGNSSKSVKWFP
jgi:hypothetical protein